MALFCTTISPMSEGIEELSFEDALLELEQTVAELESGNLTLDASLSLFSAAAGWPPAAAFCWIRLNSESSS